MSDAAVDVALRVSLIYDTVRFTFKLSCTRSVLIRSSIYEYQGSNMDVNMLDLAQPYVLLAHP